MSLTIEQTINQLVIQQVDGDTLEITTQGPQGPAGPSTTFTVAGNSGPSQTIGNGDTLTLTSPVSFQQVVMSAVDTATFSWPDQSGRVFLASPADGSAGTPAFRAITFADLDAVLGTMAQQDANAVAITGGTMSAVAITLGSINNTPIGGTTPSTGAFTTLSNTVRDAVTGAVSTVLTLGHNSTGTPAAGFGGRLLFNLESNTTEDRNAAAIDVLWTTATDATRTSRMDFYLTNAGVLTNVAVLSPTNLNVALSIRPAAAVTYDLGTAAARWASVYGSQFITDSSNAHILTDGGASGGMITLITSTDTNVATRPLLVLAHRGGTAVAGFGGRLTMQLESSTTNDVNASAYETSWVVATHASRTARVRHLVYDTAEREYLRGEANGSAPMIGFLGANAIVRPTVTGSRGGNAALASLLTELANLGLIVDSTTA